MPSKQDIRNQLNQLQLHRDNLQAALEQGLRQGGKTFVQPDIQGRIDEARAGIARCKVVLRGWGMQVEDLPDDLAEDLPPSDTLPPLAQLVAGPEQQGERAKQLLVYALIGVIGVISIAGVGWVWASGQKDIAPASAQSAEGSQTRVSAPSQAQPTYDPQEAAYGPATSSPADELFDSVSSSPEAPPDNYDPTEEALTRRSPSAKAPVPTSVVATPQPAVRPTVPAVTATAIPTTQPATVAAALPVPAKMEPVAVVSSVCGSASSDKAAFIDTFADGNLENEKRRVVRDEHVDVDVDNGYLRVMPKETIEKNKPALFYRTKSTLKNFCAVLFVSNFTGQEGSVSLSFRYTERKENEQNIYKFYSFWVSVLGYSENRYYVQKAVRGRPWEIVQNKEDLLPATAQDINTLSVSCYDRDCSFFVNGVKITDIDDEIEEEAGEIRFYMKGDIHFDVNRIEIYEL